MLYLNRKGMSPLLALIILVSIAISLGILVINMINLLNPNSKGTSLCSDLDFNIKKVNDVFLLCVKDGNKLSFVIENTGTKKIDAFKISVVGSSRSYTKEITANLTSGGILDRKLRPLPFGLVGVIQEVKIVPEISVNNKYVACVEKSKSFVNLPNCERII